MIATKRKIYIRVAMGLALIVAASSVVFVFVVHRLYADLEQTLLYTLVGHELEETILSLQEDSEAQLPRSATLDVYLRSRSAKTPIPTYFESLPPGMHQSVEHNGRRYYVTVADIGNDRTYVAFDVTQVEEHERRFAIVLMLAGILAPALALMIGIRYVRKVLQPVSSIADQLSNFDPNDRHLRLRGGDQGYEVRQIAEAFNQYLERQDGFIAREQMFTAAASHELRTPISIIKTSVELMADDETVSRTSNEYIERIGRAAHDMQELIDALLFLAREPQSRFEHILKPISVSEVVLRILDDFKRVKGETPTRIRFNDGEDLVLNAEKAHIAIVIGNLFRNAVSHTTDGQVDIILRGRDLLFVDTGSGIAPDDLNHVFERGYQGKGGSGWGLGLHIAKNICDRYRWSLVITSTPETGTTAQITF